MNATPVTRPSLESVPEYAPEQVTCAVDLRDNVSFWGAPPHALEVLRSVDASVLSVYPAAAAAPLTQAVATFAGVRLDEVAAGCGSDDLIDAALRAVAEPGSVVAHPAPSFSMVPIFARLNSLRPIGVPVTAAGEADADAILASNPRVIYLCSPNNPTGTITPASVVRRIVHESNAVVILDGAYAEFAPSMEDLVREAPTLERLLVLRTFSKAWGLAGLRVGYAVGSAALIRAVRKSTGPYKVNTLGMRAATAALAFDVPWMREHAANAVAVRMRVTEVLRELGFSPLDSHGNFVCIPVADSQHIADALRRQGVAVRAFVKLPVFGDVLRVGMAPWPIMEQFLHAVREVTA